MNICMITTTLPPVVGGLETHVWDLSRRLAAAGHSVSLIGTRNYRGSIFPVYEEKEGVTVFRLKDTVLPVYRFRYRLYAVRAFLLARRLHRRRPFDVVHVHQVYPAGVSGALLRSRYRIPLAITVHGASLIQNWEVSWIRPLIRWALKRADLLIAVGEELREKLIVCGVETSRIELLPNTVDTDRFSPVRSGREIRGRFGWGPEDLVVAYAGRLIPAKGPQYFMKMARLLLEDRPNLKFLVVGEGELEAEFRRQALSSARPGSFRITGGVDYELVPDYLAATDILVVPSLWEPGGRSCLEGMAMGKAVIANRVGGMAGLIRDGETGFLVGIDSSRSRSSDPGLPEGYVISLARLVGKLAEDPGLRKEVGRNARREAETRYGLDSGVQHILSLYERAARAI